MFYLNNDFFDRLLGEAEKSERKRSHHNIHNSHNEPVQRLCIALKKGTYVRPHCHTAINGWELIMVVKGDVAILVFDDSGYVVKRFELSTTTNSVGIELQPNTYHMVFPRSDDAVIFEVKEGPFTSDKICKFATWSPEENSEGAEKFLLWVNQAVIGEKYTAI